MWVIMRAGGRREMTIELPEIDLGLGWGIA